MSFEEIRVITIVYISALLPIYLVIKNKSDLPDWVPSIYIGAFIVCALGWELWLITNYPIIAPIS